MKTNQKLLKKLEENTKIPYFNSLEFEKLSHKEKMIIFDLIAFGEVQDD
jgi:hypothetical protein